MNFSGISSQSFAGKLLRLPLRLIPDHTVVPIVQGPLRGKRWIVGSGNHGCWLGSYEFSKQQIFIENVKCGHTVYDIGANVGFYTLLSSHLVGANGHVLAFEPLPVNVEYLRRHVDLNRANNVQLFELAVSNSSGYATFQLAANPSMGHLTSASNSNSSIQVKTVALDEFVPEAGLPVPDVIKVDIEGAELDFLQGAKNLLVDNPIKLLLATHGNEVHKKCLAFLSDIGYEMKSLSNEPLEATDEILAVKKN